MHYAVEFTAAEMNALGRLLDLAVKAGGLGVAEAALAIDRKLQAAAKAAQHEAADKQAA